MGQFPVPNFRSHRLLGAMAVLALVGVGTVGVTKVAKADESISQDSVGPKVDLDILNANLLSVVKAIRLQTGASIIVVGGDKAYNSVSLTVTGPLTTVLNYVALSAGAKVSRNSDGVYILRPIGQSDDATADDASLASTTASVAAAPTSEHLHWERMKLQYQSPKYVLTMLRDRAGLSTLPADAPTDGSDIATNVKNSVYVPVQPFTAPSANTGEATDPGVPNGNGTSGGNYATQANRSSSDFGSTAQQFVPPFQGGGGGGAGGFGPGAGAGFGPGGGDAGGGAQGGQASLRPDGVKSIIADQQDNSLLVQGDAEGIQELRQIIQLLDIPAKQVQIKAEFITATVAVVDQFGINFQLVPAPNLSTSFTGDSSSGSTVVEFSQGNLVAQLEAQLSKDNSKIVTAPLITTTNGTTASINFRELIPYVTATTSVTGSGTATQSQGVGFLSVVSSLTVTPQVNGDNSVTLNLNLPQQSTNPSADASLPPTVTSQQVTTLRTVADGETMVIGGLVSNNDSNARVSVPFLGNLPVLGSLFRTRNINNADTELLIFITPTVLPYPGQYTTPTPAIDAGVGVTP